MQQNEEKAPGALEPQLNIQPTTSRRKSGIGMQVDIGNYVLHQGLVECGEVWVTSDPDHPEDTSYTIEHWGLYQHYNAPSEENSDTTVRLVYQEGEWSSVSDFIKHFQGTEGAIYIKSCCHRITS